MTTPGGPFPARDILAEFNETEARLLEPLRHIPYCRAHEQVWSPVLAGCIIDACHQLDSLWKVTARAHGYTPAGKEFNIVDYHLRFGVPNVPSSVHRRWAIFWADQGLQLQPFALWDGGPYAKLPWWDVYTALKHDRWANTERATLREAVSAVAALFLGIVRCEYAAASINEAGWLSSKPVPDSDHGNPSHPRNLPQRLIEDSGANAGYMVVAESKLFAYPVGYWDCRKTAAEQWRGLCSTRFRKWFDNFVSP